MEPRKSGGNAARGGSWIDGACVSGSQVEEFAVVCKPKPSDCSQGKIDGGNHRTRAGTLVFFLHLLLQPYSYPSSSDPAPMDFLPLIKVSRVMFPP